MTYDVLDGWWTDAGLPETLYRATTLVRERALRGERVEDSAQPQTVGSVTSRRTR
jgi:hypothetical protein